MAAAAIASSGARRPKSDASRTCSSIQSRRAGSRWTAGSVAKSCVACAHPARVTRKSIAGYAYELIDETSIKARTTSWAPEDGGVLKKSLAKHWTSLSAAKNKLTGSGS